MRTATARKKLEKLLAISELTPTQEAIFLTDWTYQSALPKVPTQTIATILIGAFSIGAPLVTLFLLSTGWLNEYMSIRRVLFMVFVAIATAAVVAAATALVVARAESRRRLAEVYRTVVSAGR